MTGFVQIIQYQTSRMDEIDAFMAQWRERHPQMGPSRATVCQVQGKPTSYVSIVEFPSSEDAQRNNADPATQEFADFMMGVCDGPPVFLDLDVLQSEIRTDAGASRPATV